MQSKYIAWFLFGSTTEDHIIGFIVFGLVALLCLWNLYEHLPLKSWKDHLGLSWLEDALKEPAPPILLEDAAKRARLDAVVRFAERTGR